MQGDFSRFSHDPSRYYAGVLMQQGRVTLDADHNEQFDLEDHRWRVQTIDSIGQACAPERAAGFSLTFTPDGADLIIGEGRIYVDGLLVENHHGSWVDVVEVVQNAEGQLQGVVADSAPDGVPFAEGQWLELRLRADGTALGQVTAADPEQSSIAIDVAGGSGGIPADMRVRRLVTYLTQPFYHAAADPPFGELFLPDAWQGRRHLVYLDVWRRHVTAVEDAHIREVALGGPDTGTRVQTAWAVRILRDDGEPVDASELGCRSRLDRWDELTAAKAGRMTARAEAVDDPEDPCAIKPEAGYRGLENRLYRVEIHDPGPLGTATFKWSRDNGSILSRIVDFPAADQIQVSTLGKDRVLRFGADDRVEVLSEESEFAGLPGVLAAVVGPPDEVERTLFLDMDVSDYQAHHVPRARRWDHDAGLIPTTSAFTELESGVQVSFSGGPFHVGDYWTIPARVATGDVGAFVEAAPRGIDHHFARLALVTWSERVTDCRRTFPPLCHLPEGGGDGCATVTVGDGVTSIGDFSSIQEAVDAVPDEGPAHVAVLAGTYVLDGPVQVSHARLTISGCDEQSRIVAPQTAAFVLTGCSEVRLERIWIKANDRLGAVVAATSREVAVERCTVLNGSVVDRGGPATGTIVARFGPDDTTLLVDFEPAGPAVAVHEAVWVWILDNRLLGGPAVSLQAVAATVRDNTMRHGGVWVRDGSVGVAVAGNTIQGGEGPGVGLGGFARGEAPSRRSTGVRLVEVVHNRIFETGQAGVTTVRGARAQGEDRDLVVVDFDRFAAVDVDGTIAKLRERGDVGSIHYARARVEGDERRVVEVPALGDVEDVLVAGNTITGCALNEADPRLDGQATGGVVLRETVGARIVDNDIIHNGRGRRAVGVFVAGGEATDVRDNRIRGNGSAAGTYADFVPGGALEGPNPLRVRGLEFEVRGAGSTAVLPLFGLLAVRELRVLIPEPVTHACLSYFALAEVDVAAFDEGGDVVARASPARGVGSIELESDRPFTSVRFDFDPISDTQPTMTLLAFCAGSDCQLLQGGIVGVDVAAGEGGSAIGVRENEVTAPAGQALLLAGVGSMLVADNTLTSEGDTLQSCAVVDLFAGQVAPALLPKAVLVYNAGQTSLLGNQALTARRGALVVGDLDADAPVVGLGGGVVFERSRPATETVVVGSRGAKGGERDPDGRVLFHGNRASYRPAAAGFVPWSVALVSFDDLGILDNQIVAEAPGGQLLTDLVALATMLRTADNSILEPVLNAAFSAVVSSFAAHVTGNQATHCLRVTGTLAETVDNHIALQTVLPEYCEQLGGGSVESAFAVARGGR